MEEQAPPEGQSKQEERTWSEKIEMTSNELVDRVKQLIAEGNVRRLIIRDEKDQVLVEIPLTAGVVAGGLLLFYPMLAAIGAMAALLARVKVEIVRTGDKP
jgi:hypothetical protein